MSSSTTHNDDRMISLVVVGHMNPAIHHPGWYLRNGLISEKEFEVAIAGGDLVTLPQLAQFTADPIQINCDPRRWRASALHGTDPERVASIARTVFDEKLQETPVGALGINFEMHLGTTCKSVAERLAELACTLPFEFQCKAGSSARITFTEKSDLGQFSCKIEPSVRSAETLFLGFNIHVEFPVSENVPSQFSLHQAIVDRLDSASALVDTRATLIHSGVTRGANHGPA
jgi:hypothetical protein